MLYPLTLSSQLESKPSWIHHTLQKNSEIYEMIIWSCSLSYLCPQFIIQEHCKALKVLKSVGNHEEPLKTFNCWKNKAVRQLVESVMKRHWKNRHKPFGKSHKPLKVFVHRLKTLRKPLKLLEKPLATRWLALGFCPFNTKPLVYVFVWEVTHFKTVWFISYTSIQFVNCFIRKSTSFCPQAKVSCGKCRWRRTRDLQGPRDNEAWST